MTDSAVDVKGRVPQRLLDEIDDLTRIAAPLVPLVAELSRRWERLVTAYMADADYKYGARAAAIGDPADPEHPDDWDRDLDEAAGLERLRVTIGALNYYAGEVCDGPTESWMAKYGLGPKAAQ